MKSVRDCALRWASLVAVLVVAGGCASAPVLRPSVAVTPAASLATSGAETATSTPTATPTASDGLVSPPAAVTDQRNDLADEDGRKAKPNPHIDLVRLEAQADGTELQVTMTMAGDVPAKVSSNRQELNYVVEIEAEGVQTLDYWLIVTNLEGGAWYAALTDWGGNSAEEDNEFPGTFAVDKDHVTIRVPLAVLGSPSRLRMMAVTQRAEHRSGRVVAEDQVPKGDQSVPTTSWLALPPG